MKSPYTGFLGIERLIFFSQESGTKRFFLFPLRLAALCYQRLVELRLWAYEKGILSSCQLPIPVISVGNITVGGTGKTPTALALARLFHDRGRRVVVLSRGYKGKVSQAVNVVSDGRKIYFGPEDAGDEPFLLAEKLPGVPVLAGKDRALLGDYAVRNFRSDLAILDDGFQHLRLKRDLDILVLDGHSPFGNGYILPRGNLRESPQNIRRAQVIVVNMTTSGNSSANLLAQIRIHNPRAPIFLASYVPVRLEKLREREAVPLDFLQGRRVVALAGLANPESFSALLKHLGAEIVDALFYPDHCRYDSKKIDRLRSNEIIVTTEKDAVKLRLCSLCDVKILVLGVDLKVEKELQFIEQVKNKLPSVV